MVSIELVLVSSKTSLKKLSDPSESFSAIRLYRFGCALASEVYHNTVKGFYQNDNGN